MQSLKAVFIAGAIAISAGCSSTIAARQDPAASLAGLRIEVPCGATVIMGAYDSNDVAIANHERSVIAGVVPAPQPIDGQFFQLDVESATPRK